MFDSKPGASRLFYDSFLWGPPVQWRRLIAYGALVLLGTGVIGGHGFVADGAVLKDEHAVASLELAMVRAYCGQPSSYSRGARVAEKLQADMERRHTPLRQLIAEQAGSVDAYCLQADLRAVNNENSLMLVEAAVLRVRPGLSLSELGQWLHGIRIVGLGGFVLFMIGLGASLWLALATFLSGLVVLNAMPDYVYSGYPFLFVLVLLLVSAYGVALRGQWGRRLPGVIGCGLAAGVLSAFVVNMRTSYLPVAAVCLAGFVAANWWLRPDRASWRAKGWRTLAFTTCAIAGYAAFQVGLITRHLPADAAGRASHSVMHPLVLALAVPESPFSQARGIRWHDEVGPVLARSIDPNTDYLGTRYSRAMWRYYRDLWSRHPREMLDVYRRKFAVSSTEIFTVLRGSPGPAGLTINVLLTPLAWLAGGVGLVVPYAGLVVVCSVVVRRRESVAAFALGLLSAAALLLQIESGVVYSLFAQQYHNYAGFYAMFLSLVGLQALINAAHAWAYG